MPRKAAFKPVTRHEFARALKRYAQAHIDVSWRGSRMPEDHAEIDMEFELAVQKMMHIIDRLLQAKMEP